MDSQPVEYFERIRTRKAHTAIIDASGKYSYGDLEEASNRLAAQLLAEKGDLEEGRVAFLTPPCAEYVATLWGIWKAGGVAVPLCTAHPARELAYTLDDCAPSAVVVHPRYQDRVFPLAAERGIRRLSSSETKGAFSPKLPRLSESRRALILYTSGTTSKPKGVVLTHGNLQAQIRSLVEAWEYRPDDRILHVLPLHHTHGIVNALLCPLWAGGSCRFVPKFTPQAVWEGFVQGGTTLFMAVPTIYAKLIAAWEETDSAQRNLIGKACRQMRLMASGSAALPVSAFETWKRISGHTLLERYGMTELGMALTNPLEGERRPGFVGVPMPGVVVRLHDEEGTVIKEDDLPGEIRVRGPNVFSEYWRRPRETHEAFQNGWFRTGDIALRHHGYYRILGRDSVDIIKTGGYKVSALEIEESLRTHPAVSECAVVGVGDAVWGECVSAAVIVQPGETLTLEALRNWGKRHMAAYKVPARLRIVDDLPKNVMGKVAKTEVRKLF